MFQGFSYVKLNESSSSNISKLNDNIIKNKTNEWSGISRVITGVTNNTENKIERIIYSSDTETADIPTKKGLLKHLLIGGTILAGVGALAAGGFYCLAGRQNTGNRSENMSLPNFSDAPASVDRILWGAVKGSLTTSDYASRSEVGSTAAPETPLSPYSHYEKMYGSRATQNQTRQRASTRVTDKPDITTTRSSTSAYMVTKQAYYPVISENHDKVRTTFYNTLMGDYEKPQPLGPMFHNQISDFCYSELIKSAIEQAYTGDEKQRCNVLHSMSDIIEDFISDEILLIDEHDQLKELTKYEYMEELIIKRKVTTLIMAAESMMENRNFDEFYIDAMKNYKQYSDDEIENKEIAIWDYLSDNECLDDYEDSNEDSYENSGD